MVLTAWVLGLCKVPLAIKMEWRKMWCFFLWFLVNTGLKRKYM